jgi:peptidoglycan/LPS O-acetylase OafA/YrhL
MVSAFIAPLTGVRFIFAFLVVVYHIGIYSAWLDGLAPEWRGVIQSGPVAVNFFFVLSGFILTLGYTGRGAGLREFYAARVARIYPVYLLGLLLMLPVMATAQLPDTVRPPDGPGMWLSLAASAGMVQAWIPEWSLHWNSPGWSLSAEAFFYGLFPLLLLWVARLGARGAAGVMLGAYAVSLLLPVGLDAVGVIDLRSDDVHWDRAMCFANFWPLLRLPEFVLGMAAGAFFLRRPAGLERAAPAMVWGGLVCIVAGLVAGWGVVPLVVMTNGGLGLCMAVLLLGMACRAEGLSRLCGAGPMVLLGKASYALYIIHVPVIFMTRDWISAHLSGAWAAAFYAVLCVGLSLAVYRWIEVPCQHFIRRRLVKP